MRGQDYSLRHPTLFISLCNNDIWNDSYLKDAFNRSFEVSNQLSVVSRDLWKVSQRILSEMHNWIYRLWIFCYRPIKLIGLRDNMQSAGCQSRYRFFLDSIVKTAWESTWSFHTFWESPKLAAILHHQITLKSPKSLHPLKSDKLCQYLLTFNRYGLLL